MKLAAWISVAMVSAIAACAPSGVRAAEARQETYTQTLVVSDSIAYAENVMVHDDGSITLDVDRSQPRLLTDNLAHAAAYPSGVTYRFLMPDGTEWEDAKGLAKTILTDGRISEHVALKTPDTATLEFDLKGTYYVDRVELYPYFYESAGYIESISVATSPDGAKWEDLGAAKTPWPVLTHGTLPITHDAVDRFARFIRVKLNMAEKNRRGTINLIEVRIWGFPHFRTDGYVVTKPIDIRDGDMVTTSPSFENEVFCGPAEGTGEAMSLVPLDEPEALPLHAPTDLKAEAVNPEWPAGKLPPNTEFHYRVSTIGRGETAADAHVVVKTPDGRSGHVTLTWDEVKGATAYRIFRGAKDGGEVQVGVKNRILPGTPMDDIEWSSWVDWGVAEPNDKILPKTKPTARPIQPPVVLPTQTLPNAGELSSMPYEYRVSAWDVRGESAASPAVAVKPDFRVGAVALTWENVPGASGYKIYCRKPTMDDPPRWALVARLSSSQLAWIDTGQPIGCATAVRPCDPGPLPPRSPAPWAFTGMAMGPGIHAFQQFRFDLHAADGQRTPVLRQVTLRREEPVGRSCHIGDRTFPVRNVSPHNINNSLTKSDKWLAFDVEEKCELLDGYRYQEGSMSATAIQAGRVVYKVEQPGAYHLGIVYRDDMDGRETWHVSINGKPLITILGNHWIWEWDHIEEKHKDQNDYLWLSTRPIEFTEGDTIEIINDGPVIACYRIDKLLFVPEGVDVLGEIGVK